MSKTNGLPFFPKLTWIYRNIARMHSAVPFYWMPSGYAFPAWHYFFEVTRRCNLRCRMCQYQEWFARNPASEQLPKELSTEDWLRLVDQTGRATLITFTGGEPWVRKDFDEILAYAAGKRRVHVITNGLLLNRERAERCVALAPRRLLGRGLCFLGVSLDGPPEIHNIIRGRQNAFEETTQNIRYLVEKRNALGKTCPRIHVTTVIQPDNVERLQEMPCLVSQLGAEVLNLTMEVRFPELEGMGKKDPDRYGKELSPLPEIPREPLKKALEQTQAAADKVGVELRLPAMPMEEMLNYHDGGISIVHYQCRSAWTNLHIGAHGDAFPCVLRHVGNVREETLSSLWNNDRMRSFRKRLQRGPYPVCQGCCHLEFNETRPSGCEKE